MRCSHCGYTLDGKTSRCPRCGADLSSATRVRTLLWQALFVLLAVAFVALLTYAVLSWHDTQAREHVVPYALAPRVARTTS